MLTGKLFLRSRTCSMITPRSSSCWFSCSLTCTESVKFVTRHEHTQGGRS